MNMSHPVYYNQSVEEVEKEVKTSLSEGLNDSEVVRRMAEYGYNEFLKKKKKPLLLKFLNQFKSFMIWVLLIAALVSGITGYLHGEGFADAIIILAIVILNAVIGFIQENNAENALEALEQMSAPRCKVTRNGQTIELQSKMLVPGDIVILETGDSVPADLRLFESVNLKIQEATLTGESIPSEKMTDKISSDHIPLGDRDNMAYSSGSVVYGRGSGIVVATGMNTEVGKIASMIHSTPDRKTPLQQKLDKLGKHLGIAAIIICAIIFAVGFLHGNDVLSMFMIAVSLAAAAIPEGLPAVSTIVLAMGVQKMAKENAIVRTLPSVETLGSVNIICSDKTGTLTQNKMTVTEMYTDNKAQDATSSDVELSRTQKKLVEIAILANDGKLSEQDKERITIGDPTETSLIDLGLKFGLDKNILDNQYKRTAEIPFDSVRKLMTTINDLPDDHYQVNVKGALDELLLCCASIYVDGEIKLLTDSDKELIRKQNTVMAERALRVLAMAYKTIDILPAEIASEAIERDLIYVGMVGMIDPPRSGVKESVETCRQAGIKPVMITGDHKITAVAIAQSLGIMQEGDIALTGEDVERMNDRELEEVVPRLAVCARVSPEIKVRIVKAFQAKGNIVAMTGDGVNDAPALKLANIGVAMGITGTDVSKEASDIILADDNFSTIVTAVKEGRRIYDNIMKAIEFLLSTNVGELIVLFVAVMANWATPLLPIHILWINLVTDSLPALALAVDPADKDVMKSKPTDTTRSILNREFSIKVLLQGCMIGLLALTAYQIGLHTTVGADESIDVARAMCFSVLAFAQLVHIFNIRSKNHSAFTNLLNNKFLLIAVAISAGLMALVVEVPYLQALFRLSDVSMVQWLWIIGLSIAPLPVVELVKLFLRR